MFFKKLEKGISYKEVIQVDGAFSSIHNKNGNSPVFADTVLAELDIESMPDYSESTITEGDLQSFLRTFDGTETNFDSNDRILLWKLYWLEYINAFDRLSEMLPNSVATIFLGRQAIEIGFKYLLLKKTGKIKKTHDLKLLSKELFLEYNIKDEYMEFVDVFCEKYVQYMEGNRAEYFRYPEYLKDRYFAGVNLDLEWVIYNFVLILMKLMHFAEVS